MNSLLVFDDDDEDEDDDNNNGEITTKLSKFTQFNFYNVYFVEK